MIQIIPNFHPVVVHFPVALTMVAFAAALAAQFFKKRAFASQLATVSHYLLWLAAATALVAIAFGWQAYNSVNHDDAGHAAMNVHKFWAFSTTGTLVLLALFDFKKYQSNTIMPIFMVCLLGLASASVGATAWLGGEVVYRHGIGVLSLPQPEEDGGVAHDHEHAHESMKMDMPTAAPTVVPNVEPTVAPTKQTEPSKTTESQANATHVDGQHEHSGHDHHKHQNNK